MSLRVTSPTAVRIEGHERQRLELHLTYRDKKVDYELTKAKNNSRLLYKLGEEGFREYINELKAQRMKCLLFEDDEGFWTYSGLAEKLGNLLRDTVSVEYERPEAKPLPWYNTPDKKPRPYQLAAMEALLERGHAGVEMGTGLGKSFIIQLLAKSLGLKTVIMAPSTSIARQLYDEFTHHFGRKYVGLVGDGKKEFKKLIVIAIGASLTRLEPDTEAWEHLSKAKLFVADESHLTPAKTLQKVCFGLLKDAPFRFFFSGTQMRNDGLDLVLDGITGPIVYRMTVREGVDGGYLAKPIFTVIRTTSDSKFFSHDANEMTRAHLYYNPKVNQLAADIANKSVDLLKRPTLILVEEIEQFTHLLPYLKHKVAFAHGGVTPENREKLPKEFWDSDPNALVKEFNEGKLQILVGTSCVATGTDIKAARQVIYLMGGKSEIQVRQAIGRGTRLFEDKVDCYFTDFDITNIENTHRHALERADIFNEVYGPVRFVG